MIGTVVGALGGAGLAVAYNHKKGIEGTVVTWSENALSNFFIDAVLLYLAVAHFGRGRGNWLEGEYPLYWRSAVEKLLSGRDVHSESSQQLFDSTIRIILKSLYKYDNI